MFTDFFKQEIHRFCRPRNIFLALIFLGGTLYLTLDVARQYNDIHVIKEHFKSIEKQKIEKFGNYSLYGALGFRVMYIPSPLSILFSSAGVFDCLTASLNIGERLDIDASVKGQGMFKAKRHPLSDFSGLFQLFGVLLVLFFGFEAYLDKGYLGFFAGQKGKWRVYAWVFLARYMIINLYFLVVMGLSIGVARFSGIIFSGSDYLFMAAFALSWLVTSIFIFAAGAVISHIPSKALGIIAVFLVWILFEYASPLLVNKNTAEKAGSITSNLQNELEKLTELGNFEKRALTEIGKFSEEIRTSDREQNLINSFMEKEYPRIRESEWKVEKEEEENIAYHQKLSLVAPTTFQAGIAQELSSKGYSSIADFHRYTEELKHRFCIFYKDNKFFKAEEKVVNFIENEENIYYAKPRLHDYYFEGLALYLGLGVILALLGYVLYKNDQAIKVDRDRKTQNPWQGKWFREALLKGGLFKRRPEKLAGDTVKTKPIKHDPLHLEKGGYKVLSKDNDRVRDYLYTLFSGNTNEWNQWKARYKGKIYLDKTEISARPEKLVCICPPLPGEIPGDIRVKDFIGLMLKTAGVKGKERREIIRRLGAGYYNKRFYHLEGKEKLEVVMGVLPYMRGEVYLLDDPGRQMSCEALFLLKEKMEEIVGQGAAVVLLTAKSLVFENALPVDSHFGELPGWSRDVEMLRENLEYSRMMAAKAAEAEEDDEDADDEDEAEDQ